MSARSWDVEPGVGVGPLRFGTPRAELQALLGPHQAFRHSPTSDLADQYEAGMLMLTCSHDEGLHLIEIPDPDGVYYHGVHLGGAVTTVLKDLRDAGIEVTADESGWLLADGSLTLYPPSPEPDAQVEAAIAVGPGHQTQETAWWSATDPTSWPIASS